MTDLVIGSLIDQSLSFRLPSIFFAVVDAGIVEYTVVEAPRVDGGPKAVVDGTVIVSASTVATTGAAAKALYSIKPPIKPKHTQKMAS